MSPTTRKRTNITTSRPTNSTTGANNDASEQTTTVRPSTWSRIVRRLAVSASLLVLMYAFSYYKDYYKRDQYRAMASVHDHITGPPLAQQLPCSEEYSRERFSRCAPKRCGRFVSDSIVTEREAMELRLLAETVFAISQPSGGVAIFDLNSGALSNGTNFVNLYQILRAKKSTLIKQRSLDTFRAVKNKLAHSISIHFGASSDALYLTSPAFLTRITNAKAATLNDEYWHAHIDKETYGTFVYTSLLYLSTYQDEFAGGRFIYLDANQNITVEPKMGRVSAFTSSTENMHMVEPVISGARFALTIPFTCDPAMAIKEPTL